MADAALDTIFKAYDVRGIYPDEIDESIARRIGNAFVAFTGAARVLVGRDARPSSEPLVAAFTEGATIAGADVVDLGLASTDLCYFAAGSLDAPAAMFTASHNPAQYNGIKLCRAGAAPIGAGHRPGRDQGDGRRRAARAGRGPRPGRATRPAAGVRRARPVVRRPRRAARRCASSPTPPTASAGSSCRRCSPGCRSSSRCSSASSTARSRTTPPTRSAVENLKDLQRGGARRRRRRRARVRRRRRPRRARRRPGAAGLGLHHHRDPRRGDPRPAPGRDGRAQPDLLEGRARGDPRARRHADPQPRRSLVHQAGDGRDRRGLRRRALGALLLPRQLPRRLRHHRRAARARAAVEDRHAALRAAHAVRALRAVGRDQHPRRRSARRSIERVAEAYADAEQDRLDGLTVDLGDWWFNLRPSNTEPLLRLNLEAPDRAACDAHTAEVLALVRGDAVTDREGRHDGARPEAARDPRVPRGQGPAALLRGRVVALQPAPASVATRCATTSRSC